MQRCVDRADEAVEAGAAGQADEPLRARRPGRRVGRRGRADEAAYRLRPPASRAKLTSGAIVVLAFSERVRRH